MKDDETSSSGFNKVSRKSSAGKLIGFTKNGNSFYRQRYREQWEKLPQCRGWLTEHPETPLKAFCKVCKAAVQANRKDIVRHSDCKKHLENYEKAMPLYDSYSTNDNSEADEYKIIKYLSDDDDDGTIGTIYMDQTSNDLVVKESDACVQKSIKIKFKPSPTTMTPKSEKENTKETATATQKCTRWCCNFPEAPPVYEDSYTVFGRYVVDEMKNLLNEMEKQKVKMKINTILFHACTGQYDPQEFEERDNLPVKDIPRPQIAEQQEDQSSSFGRYIAHELRGVKSRSAQMLAKQQICNAIYKSINFSNNVDVFIPQSPNINSNFL